MLLGLVLMFYLYLVTIICRGKHNRIWYGIVFAFGILISFFFPNE